MTTPKPTLTASQRWEVLNAVLTEPDPEATMDRIAKIVHDATADLRAERDALRAKVERVKALHRKAPESDIHGEPICVVCGMRETFPCATLRLIRGEA